MISTRPILRWSSPLCGLLALTVATALSACSAVSPGYVPPGSKPSPLAALKPFEAGEVADNGVYQPSAQEQALDCGRLTGSMRIIISRLKDFPNRPRASGLAAAAQQASTSVTGKPGIDMTAEERREKARLVAFNKLLAGKKCTPMNIDAELAGKS